MNEQLFTKDPITGRIHLSEKAWGLTTTDLIEEVYYQFKIRISKAAAYRAKKAGHLSLQPKKVGNYAPGGWIPLTREERKMKVRELSRELGVSTRTASAAKRRGWFAVTPTNRNNLKVSKSRIRHGVPPAT